METPLAPGAIVAERYQIDALLGEGGMGVVYRASHVHMRKWVALKVLLPEWTSTPEVVARFEREAVVAGTINHPNVATATDFGRLGDGSFFLVLEYVEGRTLRKELEAGALEPARALHILRGIVRGVAAAHAVGIVHRDLKPENVMLVDRDGDRDYVKVLDFGIAKLGASAPSGAALTNVGAILGTPDYMAPEQALGGTVDARADLYAIGVMLYELLTGEPPFKGGAVTLLRQHILDAVPELPAPVSSRVPPGLQALVTRLMQKEPSARLASANDLVAAIDEALRDLRGGVPVAPAVIAAMTPAEPVAPPITARFTALPARTRLALVAGAVLLAAIAVVFVSTTLAEPTPTAYVPLPPPPAPNAKPSASAPPPAAPPPSSSASAAAKLPPPSPSGSAKHGGRHTGPAGIYIPPPSQWFR
jgi:serine/threonine-protein kinase